jgi:signal transduction histidine kinase
MDDLIRRWRRIGVWVPVAFVTVTASAAILGLGRVLPDLYVLLFIIAVTAIGAGIFSLLVFRILGHAQRETERRARYLAAINEASLALSSELDLSAVLQKVVDLSCAVTDARYGALALADESGRITQFLTSGLTREERQRIGALPEGKGLLGVVIHDGKSLRVDNIRDHPRSSGFPPNHPPMTSFIGIPIFFEGRVVGDLYLTDKNGGDPFTQQDEEMMRVFAAHAAIAIENARLYQQVQDLAVLEERDRIGMDLHDGIIQSLYAMGLKLENALQDLEHEPELVPAEIERSIDDLNQTIADIRSYIMNLRPAVLADTDLAGAIGGLLQELKVNALMDVSLEEEPDACRGLSRPQIDALFHVAQEALTNVRKHANATRVSARLRRANGIFEMTVADDGNGFDPDARYDGYGLRNMRERVEAMGGRFEVRSDNGTGTKIIIGVPVRASREEQTHA